MSPCHRERPRSQPFAAEGRRRSRRRLVASAIAAIVALGPAAAAGQPAPDATPRRAQTASPAPLPLVAFLPTRIADDGAQRLPTQSEPELLMMATSLDALLSDTAQDLGLTVDLTYRAPGRGARLTEADLAAQARAMGGILVSPSIEILPGGDVELRLLLADARSRALALRIERVVPDDLPVRAVVMLRDLVTELRAPGSSPAASRPDGREPPHAPLATPARSAGRATLAINATIWGGLIGFSIQRASGSDDPRLLYPLLAVGAGIGLGGAIIVAEEWDVGVGDAWYLVSGAWWPTLASHLLYEGRFGDLPGDTPLGDERWSFGLIGGTTGLALATLGLTLGGMSEGGALLAHSGGGLGLVLGGLTELAVRGDIYRVPFAGMGYGAGLGWLAAAAAARLTQVTPSRVLSIDLGGIVGGLGGAALGSPLLFDEPTAGQQRAWLGITAGGSLIGAGVAWYMTRSSSRARPEPSKGRASALNLGLPVPGILGQSVAKERRAPVLGLTWQGMLP